MQTNKSNISWLLSSEGISDVLLVAVEQDSNASRLRLVVYIDYPVNYVPNFNIFFHLTQRTKCERFFNLYYKIPFHLRFLMVAEGYPRLAHI